MIQAVALGIAVDKLDLMTGPDAARDGDWMELTWTLHHAHPDLFIEVMTILRTRFHAFQAAQDAGEKDEDGEVPEHVEGEKEFHKTVVVDPDEDSAI